MSTGTTVANDTDMYALVTSLKTKRDELSSVTAQLDQLNSELVSLQTRSSDLTAANVSIKTQLAARLDVLFAANTSSEDAALDDQCVTFSATYKNNEDTIASINTKIPIVQDSITVTTAQQAVIAADAASLFAQVVAKMDTLRV